MQQAPMIKEYLDILFRRKWWIIVPALLGLLLSIGVYYRVDKRYMAETRVQMRPQAISERLLPSIVESNPQDQITAITAEITSERYVQEVDRELKLVGAPGGPADLVELTKRLTAAINLSANPKNRYFDLKVSWSDPRLAAEIANKLAAIYIERYSELRQQLATGTLDQLRVNRIEIEAKLKDVRAEIEQYRARYKFELNSYQNENRLQFERNAAEIDRLNQQIRDWQDESQDIDLRLRAGVGGTTTAPTSTDPRLTRLDDLRRRLGDERAAGRADNHPSVSGLLSEIARLEKEIGPGAGGSDASTPRSREEYSREGLQNEKVRLTREIGIAQAKIDQLTRANEEIRGRQERTPDNQIQLDSLETLEDQLASDYMQARNREQQAQTGELVEEMGKGEKFEILTKARQPGAPYYPDFKLFLLMGLAVGVGIGCSVVLLLEVFDQSFKSEEQLAASIDLPILAVIPDLTRVAEQGNKRRAARERRAS